jgi:hypothetical protein
MSFTWETMGEKSGPVVSIRYRENSLYGDSLYRESPVFIFKPFLLLPPFEEVKGPFSKVNGGYEDGHVHDSFKKVFLYVFFWGFVPIFTLHNLHIAV